MTTSSDDVFNTTLSTKQMRRTFLVTYSQANRTKFPTRQSFGEEVAKAFDNGSGKAKPLYWACALEPHTDRGEHYHVSIKLSGAKRWLSVKNHLHQKHNVVVHFSDNHDNYYSAFKYISKSDKDVYQSSDHPNLQEIGSPKTKKCVSVYRANKQNEQTLSQGNSEQNITKTVKPKRLSNLDVSEFMLAQNIKTQTGLFAIADEQKKEGKKDLANYVLSRSTKSINDLIENTWKMESASKRMRRSTISRMQLIRERKEEDCVESCNGLWLECALEVLTQNKINPPYFSGALRELFNKGRGKHRNIMITGPANCAKTFLFRPLDKLFETFCNPSNDKYAWIGVEEAEVIFLNDFRWSSELIAWKELLLLLEGQTVHLPSPKNQYCKDISLSTDIPIFATSKSKIRYKEKFNLSDSMEDDMMDARWKFFEFFYQIPQSAQKDLEPCAKCFCELVLLEEI